jgi:predicted alpha/beta-hydrolase family hydrolase
LNDPSELQIAVPTHGQTTALVYFAEQSARPAHDKSTGPSDSRAALILAHGAGAGQRSPFMVAFARAVSALGVDVVTFNFLYTEQRRRTPDRGPLLEACYAAVIAVVRDQIESARQSLFICGKSMGGRIATQVAAAHSQLPVAGIVLLGYPLHPPGRPEPRRDAHLPSVKRPMLFVQGSRDAFGTPAELSKVIDALRPPATLHVVEDGDHSFKRTRMTPAAQAAVYEDIQQTIVAWIGKISRR